MKLRANTVKPLWSLGLAAPSSGVLWAFG